MITARTLRIASVLCGIALGGISSVEASFSGHSPGKDPYATHTQAGEGGPVTASAPLMLAQSRSRSYLEGRDFQSYQRDRGFAGERNFGSYPDTRGGAQNQRPYSLKRRRIYGPGGNRCAGWSRRCAQTTGDAPGDFQSCMRYHGCR